MNKHSARLRAAFHGRKRVKKAIADFLLIDISNSFTKLAFASRSRIGPTSKISTPILTADRIARILHAHDAATVVASSVVPKKNREIKRAAGNRKVIWLTSQSRLNVRIDYPNAKTIGADRLANAVAEVDAVHENLTLEGLRLVGCMNSGRAAPTNVRAQRCRWKSNAAIVEGGQD